MDNTAIFDGYAPDWGTEDLRHYRLFSAGSKVVTEHDKSQWKTPLIDVELDGEIVAKKMTWEEFHEKYPFTIYFENEENWRAGLGVQMREMAANLGLFRVEIEQAK